MGWPNVEAQGLKERNTGLHIDVPAKVVKPSKPQSMGKGGLRVNSPNGAEMDAIEVTREWLDSVGDEQGLTRGQRSLLDDWCKGAPYVGKTIPAQVAQFIAGCRGYRGQTDEMKAWRSPFV